jgi:predicted transcriptional regulator
MTRVPDLAVGAQATVEYELLQRTDSAVAVVAGITIDTVLARPAVS